MYNYNDQKTMLFDSFDAVDDLCFDMLSERTHLQEILELNPWDVPNVSSKLITKMEANLFFNCCGIMPFYTLDEANE